MSACGSAWLARHGMANSRVQRVMCALVRRSRAGALLRPQVRGVLTATTCSPQASRTASEAARRVDNFWTLLRCLPTSFLRWSGQPRSPLAVEKFGKDSGEYPGLCNRTLSILQSGRLPALYGEPIREYTRSKHPPLIAECGRASARLASYRSRIASARSCQPGTVPFVNVFSARPLLSTPLDGTRQSVVVP
jgi:hypothetical protein